MAEQSENVVLEILRRIQADIAEMRNDISNIKAAQIEVRMQLHSINGKVFRQRPDFTDG
jgi:hypothetical protein